MNAQVIIPTPIPVENCGHEASPEFIIAISVVFGLFYLFLAYLITQHLLEQDFKFPKWADVTLFVLAPITFPLLLIYRIVRFFVDSIKDFADL